MKLNVSVVDATKTLTALHQQSSKESELAGQNNEDAGHNFEVIGQFNYEQGHTYYSQYETILDLNLIRIEVRARLK